MPNNNYLVMALKPETLLPIFVNKSGEVAGEAADGAEIRFNYLRPFEAKYVKVDDSVIIDRLPLAAMIPDWRINSLATGKVEMFAKSLGFSDAQAAPLKPTIAIWSQIMGQTFSFELVYGGPNLEILFPMSKWLGAHKRAQGGPDTIISACQPASTIRFRKKSTVTDWNLIQEM